MTDTRAARLYDLPVTIIGPANNDKWNDDVFVVEEEDGTRLPAAADEITLDHPRSEKDKAWWDYLECVRHTARAHKLELEAIRRWSLL